MDNQNNDQVKILDAAIWIKKPLEGRVNLNLPINIKGGDVFTGSTHDACFALANDNGYNVKRDCDGVLCGFLTSKNKIETRGVSAHIAYESGQTKTLLSELYSNNISLPGIPEGFYKTKKKNMHSVFTKAVDKYTCFKCNHKWEIIRPMDFKVTSAICQKCFTFADLESEVKGG